MARIQIDALPEQTVLETANNLVVSDTGVTKRLAISLLVADTTAKIAAHVAAAGAHSAANISFTPGAGFVSTQAQAAILEAANIAVTALTAHIADATDAHDASAISFVPAGGIAATDAQAAVVEVGTALTNHVIDAVDAHDASAISFVPGSGIAATNVQTAIVEAKTDAEAVTTSLATLFNDHLNDPTDAHDASAISFVPTGSIAATTVQAAIVEVASEAGGSPTAASVSFSPASGIAATNVQDAIVEAKTDAEASLTAHLNDTTDAHDASAISFAPASGIAATDVQAAIVEAKSDAEATAATALAGHAAASSAHAAVNLSFTPAAGIAATNVQTAIQEALTDANTHTNTQVNLVAVGLGDHLNDTTDAHDASAISFAATGTIAATNVQTAIAELGTEKVQGLGGGSAATGLWIGTQTQYDALGGGVVATVVYVITGP